MFSTLQARILAGVAVAAVLLAAGAWLDRHAPLIGAQATINRLAQDSSTWQSTAGSYRSAYESERQAFAKSEALRQQETSQARATAQALADQADARVEAAQRSAEARARIINKEPTYDPNGCPMRELVSAGELRDALAPARAASR